MGITIHWEGSTRSKKKAEASIEFVRDFARALNLRYEEYEDIGVVVENRIYRSSGELWHKWIDFCEDSKRDFIGGEYVLGESECFGVMVDFPEPVRIETFDFRFFKYEKKWITRGFCKTQVFSDDEIYNLHAHVVLVSMLATIKNTWILNLEISDEAFFYLPLDEKEKKKHIEKRVTEKYRDHYMKLKPFNFEQLVKEHGLLSRQIHATADALRSLGVNLDVGVKLKQENLNDYV